MHRRFAAVAAILFVTSVVAQEERPLTDLHVCRLDDEQVVLSFKFEASPCWEVQTPRFDQTNDDEAEITIPTVQVGQVCTMNIVIYEYAEAIPLMASVKKLGVTVNDPEGRLVGHSTAAVAEPGGECEMPEEPTPAQ
jgi:hypothetical protein